MKKLILNLLAVVVVFYAERAIAQHSQLWGMTSGGINFHSAPGSIFNYNTTTSTFQLKYDFPYTNQGSSVQNSKLADPGDGKLYGTAQQGGLNNKGVIFSWDTATNVYTKLFDFGNNTDGQQPCAGLILYNGKLYGTTAYGGANGAGTIFSWNLATSTYVNIHDFVSTEGLNPGCNLAVCNGLLYGLAPAGGANGEGSLYSIDPSNNQFVKLHDFAAPGASHPKNSLTVVGNKLYGTSYDGGVYSLGNIFEYTPASNQFIDRVSFDGSAGIKPYGGVTFYNGILYGMDMQQNVNGGYIYACDTTSWNMVSLYNFNQTTGAVPFGNLVIFGNKLLGFTSYGGTYGGGSFFQFDLADSSYTTLHQFTSQGNSNTSMPLILNNTAYFGQNEQTITKLETYSFSQDTLLFKVQLNTRYNGISPHGALAYHNGKYYGVTKDGGLHDAGVIFEFDPADSSYTKRFDFSYQTVGGAYGSLTYYNGKFYGMTIGTGVNDMGTIFEWDPVSNIVTKKIDFNGSNGSYPYGDLKVYNNKMYGMTNTGGLNDLGVIFEWDPATNTIVDKVDFDDNNGSHPYGSLLLFNNKFYGMTPNGGLDGVGVIFEWDPTVATNGYNLLYSFTATAAGNTPYGSLSLNNGKLYGMANQGGTAGYGVIFEYNLATNAYTRKISFDGPIKGSSPYGTLTLSGSKFYGMAFEGGDNNFGTLFEWNPSTNAFSKKFDFDYTSGSNPDYNQLIVSNAIPVLSNVDTVAHICSGTSSFTSFNVVDADNDAITFTTSSSNPVLIPNNAISVTSAGGSTYHVNFNSTSVNLDSTVINVIANDGNGGEVNFNITVTVTAPLLQNLCLVTVDSFSTHNIIIWEKPLTTIIDSFKIYRVQTFTIDTLVGTVAYNALSEFHDHSCDPNATQYDYKIATVDTCGNEGAKSPIHRTIHMLTNLGINQVNLQWNFYSGQNVNQYRVWRDSTMLDTWQQIALLSPASSSYTDNNLPGTAAWRYRVDVDWVTSCTPTAKTTASATNTTRSNTRDNYRVTTINNISASQVELFPNPATESININLNAMATIKSINVKDATGRLVIVGATNLNSNHAILNTNDLAKGIYFIELNTNVGLVRKSFVKQ